mgnify:CR=1 FL=1
MLPPAGWWAPNRCTLDPRRHLLRIRIRRELAHVLVHLQFPADRRKRALGAILAIADLAACADRRCCSRVVQIKPRGIHEPMRVPHVASQRHRESAAGRSEPAALARYAARDPQVGSSVGHAGELRQDLARLCECFVHVPKRTGAAGPGEVEVRRRLALGNVAGAVDPHEEERNTPRIGPLHRREPVAHGFEAHAEMLTEQADVVAQCLRFGQEAAIREQQGAGEVAGETDAGQCAGFVAAEALMVCERFDQVGGVQPRDLRGELERPLARLDVGLEAQAAI